MSLRASRIPTQLRLRQAVLFRTRLKPWISTWTSLRPRIMNSLPSCSASSKQTKWSRKSLTERRRLMISSTEWTMPSEDHNRRSSNDDLPSETTRAQFQAAQQPWRQITTSIDRPTHRLPKSPEQVAIRAPEWAYNSTIVTGATLLCAPSLHPENDEPNTHQLHYV